jgi:hypothetical protein
MNIETASLKLPLNYKLPVKNFNLAYTIILIIGLTFYMVIMAFAIIAGATASSIPV